MLELYQQETDPGCRRVREALSALTLDFIVRQVSSDSERLDELKRATGRADVPVLIDRDRGMVITETGDILAYLKETYGDGSPSV